MPTKIEWVDIPGYKPESLNCISGCSSYSEGCRNCWARAMTKRLQGAYRKKITEGKEPGELEKYREGFDVVRYHPEALLKIDTWREPRAVAVNLMGDIFHQDIDEQDIREMFNVFNVAETHIFMLLTKRSMRMRFVAYTRDVAEFTKPLYMRQGVVWSPNIWMGVTVEHQRCVGRIYDLKETGAAVKFISFEPLLSPIDRYDLTGIDWVIIGAESGRNARPMDEAWVGDIIENCQDFNVPVFYKQKMEKGKKISCPEINGIRYTQFPRIIGLPKENL